MSSDRILHSRHVFVKKEANIAKHIGDDKKRSLIAFVSSNVIKG